MKNKQEKITENSSNQLPTPLWKKLLGGISVGGIVLTAITRWDHSLELSTNCKNKLKETTAKFSTWTDPIIEDAKLIIVNQDKSVFPTLQKDLLEFERELKRFNSKVTDCRCEPAYIVRLAKVIKLVAIVREQSANEDSNFKIQPLLSESDSIQNDTEFRSNCCKPISFFLGQQGPS